MPKHDMRSLSTDQVAALVELAERGSIRAAADGLYISEQGVRSRLLALEQRLGVELYRKSRGVRRATPLTEHGQRLLPHALNFLDAARELAELFTDSPGAKEVKVVASQYLMHYVLIGAVRKFHKAFPQIRIRLSIRTEQQIEEDLLTDPTISLGLAAPYEPSPALEYRHLFEMNWSLITPRRHRLLERKKIRLRDLAQQPLILFERGSTGRQHVIDAFHAASVSPLVDMETTNTEIIVSLVEAGLGVSIVPLLPSGVVTRGRRIEIRSLGQQIRPIHSGVLFRRAEKRSEAAAKFFEFVVREFKA